MGAKQKWIRCLRPVEADGWEALGSREDDDDISHRTGSYQLKGSFGKDPPNACMVQQRLNEAEHPIS